MIYSKMLAYNNLNLTLSAENVRAFKQQQQQQQYKCQNVVLLY